MKIALIVCWMGEMPDYFKMWEYSCSKNPDYDFIVFTDHPRKNNYKNIKFIEFSLNDFNKLASQKLKLNIKVRKPYKLCDFKPAYGLIFEDYLKEYDFWGHCDIDQIFGSIKDFVTEDILSQYDKINKNGHFTLYRNISKMNHLFEKKGSIFNYDEVFTSDENFAFDEYTGINMIAKKESVNSIYINDFADIDKGSKRYICKNHPNFKYQFYKYYNGRIFKVYYDKEIKEQEMMYLHFQKKVPIMNFTNIESEIAIGYKKFDSINSNINKSFIDDINGHDNKFLKTKNKLFYYINKIKEFIVSSKEKKKIWIMQKKSMEEYK